MAKIVIITDAGESAIEDAKKLLVADGNEVEVHRPDTKALLHIALGLLGPGGYGFGPVENPAEEAEDEAPTDEAATEPAEDEAPTASAEETASDDGAEEEDGEEFSFEGKCYIDGDLVEARRINDATSRLLVPLDSVGAKMSFTLSESTFSFWPASISSPSKRMIIESGDRAFKTSMEIPVVDSEERCFLVGDDLIRLFKPA